MMQTTFEQFGEVPIPTPDVPPRPGEPVTSSSRPEERRSPAHDDWLLDEALLETFPASDPISPSSGT
jgi:hypothetical protein